MDDLNSLLEDLADTPAGALLVFLAVFLARVYLRKMLRHRSAKKKPKSAHGADT